LVLIQMGRWTAAQSPRGGIGSSAICRGRATAMNATVKDVMTTHVVAVRLTATYKDIAARLWDSG
jgi:hypothetical protein